MKQWVINKDKTYKSFRTLKLNEFLYVHYSSDLDIQIGTTQYGNKYFIVGTVTFTKKLKFNLNNISIKDFLYLKKYFGGKWVIYFEGVLYSDFSCIHGVFWNFKNNIVSNSFEAFSDLGIEKNVYEINENYYFNWYLPPNTLFKGVQKLMPGTILKLNITGFVIENFNYYKKLDLTALEIFHELSESLQIEAKSIADQFSKTYIALSAGYDSRLLYSIFNSIRADIETYTQIHTGMSMCDAKIPNIINHKNLKIYPKKFSKKKLELFENRIFNMVSDRDSIYFCKNQWDFLKNEEVVVRGGILELAGISSAHLENKYENFGEIRNDGTLLLYALNDFRDFQHDSLNLYTDCFIKRNSSLKWSKQLYIDLRIGGWLSYIELGLDLINGKSLHLGNCENTINLMLNIPEKYMKVKAFHIYHINLNNNDLLSIPFNKVSYIDKFKSIGGVYASKLLGDRLLTKLIY